MATEVKGGERSSGEGGTRKKGMASGGGSLEEVFTGPWDPLSKRDNPFDLEGRDEETLPLTDTGLDSPDYEDTNPFVKGPWLQPIFARLMDTLV